MSLTPALQHCINITFAAGAIFQAKFSEFEAATFTGTGQQISEARDACHSALDAWLDAKARLTVLARS